MFFSFLQVIVGYLIQLQSFEYHIFYVLFMCNISLIEYKSLKNKYIYDLSTFHIGNQSFINNIVMNCKIICIQIVYIFINIIQRKAT